LLLKRQRQQLMRRQHLARLQRHDQPHLRRQLRLDR
jgi:hypothetical protein